MIVSKEKDSNLINKIFFVSIVFALLMLMSAGSAFSAGLNISQVTYVPSPAVPGATITIFAQIDNESVAKENGVKIIATDEYPFTIKSDKLVSVGNIDAYGKAQAQFTVYVDPTAKNQTYTLPLTIKKSDGTSIEGNYNITINGSEPTLKIVGLSPAKLEQEKATAVSFEIQNVGTSQAIDVTLEIQEERTVTATGTVVVRDIIPAGASTAYVGTILPGEKKTGTIMLVANPSAEIKTYSQPVSLSYRTQSGTRTTETGYVGIKVYGKPTMEARIKDYTIVAGKTDITVELFNKGMAEAKSTIVSVTTTANGATITNPIQFIGTLASNDVDSFKITGYNIAEKISVKLSYVDSETNQLEQIIELSTPTNGQTTQDTGNPIINLLIVVVIIIAGYLGYKKFIVKKK
jgi:hypothetical protein